MNRARNRLMALLATNQSKPRRYEIVNAQSDEATIYLYDMIDEWFGVSPQTFVKDLNAIKASTIHLRINSPGGDVFGGRAIATAISQHTSKVVAHIDGLAASAASYVALAASEVEIASGAFFMIHNAWTFAYGNKEDLQATVELLQKIDDSLVDDYAKQTGQSAEQIREWMNAESYFTAEESVEYGFADRISPETQDAANACRWNLSALRKPAISAKDDIVTESDDGEMMHAELLRKFSLVEHA